MSRVDLPAQEEDKIPMTLSRRDFAKLGALGLAARFVSGYLYDASTLPTYLGPLARSYYFWKSGLSKEEKMARKELFGKFSMGFKKLKPYYHELGGGKKIAEIPVTTMPIFKLPFHLSYLIYLPRSGRIFFELWLIMMN